MKQPSSGCHFLEASVFLLSHQSIILKLKIRGATQISSVWTLYTKLSQSNATHVPGALRPTLSCARPDATLCVVTAAIRGLLVPHDTVLLCLEMKPSKRLETSTRRHNFTPSTASEPYPVLNYRYSTSSSTWPAIRSLSSVILAKPVLLGLRPISLGFRNDCLTVSHGNISFQNQPYAPQRLIRTVSAHHHD